MLTVREITVLVDDRRTARAAAAYALNGALVPRAFAPPHERAGTGPDSMWLGTKDALQSLGLTKGAEVSTDHLTSALVGRHVATGAQVVQPPHGWAATSLELIFAAPNSVSWAWCVGGAELRAQIERTMWVTAVALLSYVTDTKPVVDGREPAHGFAASAVLHATGRKSEGTPLPLLHLHCHLLGVMDTRDMLRCPHSHVLDEVDAVLECGAYGRAVLAEELRNLGFQLKACTGYEGRYFEIAGVPQGLLRPEISARTECGGPVQEAQYGWVVGPEHTDGPTVRVRLLGLGQSCWRCKRATIALVGLLPVRSSNVDNMLACMDERVLSLAAGALPENVRQSRQVGRIAARYSKTEGRRYLSNGCFHCDALLGRFPLFANELRKCIEKYGLSGLTEIIQADVRYKSIRWQLVRANTWAGAVNELSPGAYLFDGQLDDDTAGGSWEFDLREWEP